MTLVNKCSQLKLSRGCVVHNLTSHCGGLWVRCPTPPTKKKKKRVKMKKNHWLINLERLYNE